MIKNFVKKDENNFLVGWCCVGVISSSSAFLCQTNALQLFGIRFTTSTTTFSSVFLFSTVFYFTFSSAITPFLTLHFFTLRFLPCVFYCGFFPIGNCMKGKFPWGWWNIFWFWIKSLNKARRKNCKSRLFKRPNWIIIIIIIIINRKNYYDHHNDYYYIIWLHAFIITVIKTSSLLLPTLFSLLSENAWENNWKLIEEGLLWASSLLCALIFSLYILSCRMKISIKVNIGVNVVVVAMWQSGNGGKSTNKQENWE